MLLADIGALQAASLDLAGICSQAVPEYPRNGKTVPMKEKGVKLTMALDGKEMQAPGRNPPFQSSFENQEQSEQKIDLSGSGQSYGLLDSGELSLEMAQKR